MKTKLYTLLFVLMASPLGIMASNTIPDGKYTKEKRIKKEFTVNANALLEIKNSYGNVNITSWSENRVVIEVYIKTSGNNEERVQEKLDELDVAFDASSSNVSAKTLFDKTRSNSWWNSWKSSNVNMEINYTVKVPVTNALSIDNNYGGITLNTIQGNARISCDYGKITIGELLSENNVLNFDYTNNSVIGYMKSGRINADYSSFLIEKADAIELAADYTKSAFGAVRELNYNCDYGSVRTENNGKLTGRGDYVSVHLGNVSGDVNINADYGSIAIERLTPQAGNVTLRTEYTGIKIGYAPDYNFRFNIDLEYAGLSGKEGLEITKSRSESSERYYEGYHGSESAKALLNINSEYGGVKLYTN